jgi:hypothetical protein
MSKVENQFEATKDFASNQPIVSRAGIIAATGPRKSSDWIFQLKASQLYVLETAGESLTGAAYATRADLTCFGNWVQELIPVDERSIEQD